MIYNTYKKEVQSLLSFKSVSTDLVFKPEIEKTVNWLQQYFTDNKFTAKRIDGYGNPVVVARYIKDPNLETYFIYGHYDVQPASQDDGWDSDPFTLTEKEGRLYARGVVDNKGQFMIHLVSIIELIKSNELNKNIIFVVEGDEETGGDGISRLFNEQPELFKADHYIISDGEMPYQPVITASFRGTTNLTVKLTTANNNLHSGLYGGAIPGATIEAAKLIANMYDDNNKITIPNFYRDNIDPSNQEKQQCLEMDKIKQDTLKQTGVKKWFTEKTGSICGAIAFETMIMPSSLLGGYTGSGYSNIVPSSASIKFNFRIAANQSVDKMIELFKEYIKNVIPSYVTAQIIEIQSKNDPIKIDITSPIHKKAIEMLKNVYGKEVLIDYCGATLPIVVDIKKVFGADPVLISLANDDCNMHGVNENYNINLIKKGLEFSTKFFSEK